MSIDRGIVRRYRSLVLKETRQMLRDLGNTLVGLILPVMLILLFGYGISFDVKDAPVAVVLHDRSPDAQQFVASLNGSRFLHPVAVESLFEAGQLLRKGTVKAVLQVPSDFSARLSAGNASVQVLLNGLDSATALTVEAYLRGAVSTWEAKEQARHGVSVTQSGITIVQRIWFNEAAISTWYLVPGLLVLVLTLIGAILTSLLIAREWERGTLESLFVTPVRPLELTLAKLSPYMALGLIDVLLCLIAARWLFGVPIRGSVLFVIGSSMLYLLASLAIGLFISGRTRNQFRASQLSLLISFLPAMMLSGFIFDLHNMPFAVRVISHLLPATYFMELIKTLFLAGNHGPTIIFNGAILVVFVVILIAASSRTMRKKLD